MEQNKTRFIIATNSGSQESIQHILNSLDVEISLLPVAKLEFKTYKNKYSYRTWVYLAKYFVNPLDQFKESFDPLASYSSTVLKLKNNESIVTEIGLKPYRSIKLKLIKNKLLRAKLTAHSYNYRILSIKRFGIFLLNSALLFLKVLIYFIEIFNRTNPRYSVPMLINIKSNREVQILDKLYDSLLRTRFFINIRSPYKYRILELKQDVFFSLKQFNTKSKYLNKLSWKHRSNIIRQANNIFSSKELAMFYHITSINNPKKLS